MAEETQFTVKTSMVTISTSNANLDGTGTLGSVITGGTAPGTLIKTITIKAQTNTTHGMIRLFVYNGTNSRLLMEIDVPPITKSATNPSFEKRINLNFTLKEGYILKASTEKGETFNIIAEGLDWAYYATSVRADTTQLTGKTNKVSISTANSNLDGTGTLGLAYTAGSSATYKGCNIRTITIKSTVNVTSGMVRIFIDNLTTTFLLTEVPVKTETKSAIDFSFEHTIVFDDDFDLQAGYKIWASTENAENFRITTEGTDYNYVA